MNEWIEESEDWSDGNSEHTGKQEQQAYNGTLTATDNFSMTSNSRPGQLIKILWNLLAVIPSRIIQRSFGHLWRRPDKKLLEFPPLKNKDDFFKSDSTSKANILNDQFLSVFTKEDTSSLPDKGPSRYPNMPNIEVNWKGVHKLLKGLKPFKATGPDSIPAFILKAAAGELALILARIYQTSLDTGQVPSDWRDAWIVPVSKKRDKHRQRTIAPFHLLLSIANYWSISSTAMSWHILTSITS